MAYEEGLAGLGLGDAGDGGPRRRRRAPLITLGVLVLVVVLIVVAVVAVAAHRRSQRNRDRAAATATADGFLTAWSRADVAAMAALATPDTAAYVRTEIPLLARTLQISSARYTPGAVALGSDAGAPFSGAVVLQGLGTWQQSGRLALRKVGGAWRVAFAPQTITPQLTADRSLHRARTLGTRGNLVLADGSGVDGRDGELAGNLIGATGAYTAAQATAAGSSFQAGDVGGLSGLQRAYNTELAGTPGGTLTVVDASGAVVQTLLTQPTRDGSDVPLSLDLAVQHAAENALATLPAAQTGSLVAIDTTTGKVLALGNHPYDGYGRAILGHYPPGSTFKIITATAALMSGRTAATPLSCTPTTSVGGETFKNAESESFGRISLLTAFAKSCNTAFINLETTLPAGAFATAAALYGMSPLPTVQVPPPLPISSFGGSVPAPMDAADAAAEAIGQGRIVVSPLQLASVAAAVAAGTWRQPFVTATPPPGEVSHPLPVSVATTLRTFMAAVVSSGTAAGKGLPAGTFGKTGTAEYGTATPPPTVAWFIGYRGNVAFACQVGGDALSGGFGADAAAPVVAAFLRGL